VDYRGYLFSMIGCLQLIVPYALHAQHVGQLAGYSISQSRELDDPQAFPHAPATVPSSIRSHSQSPRITIVEHQSDAHLFHGGYETSRDSVSETNSIDFEGSLAACATEGECWVFQRLPDGLMFKSYLAGVKEPRFASVWSALSDHGGIWESTLGGRVGLLRYGTQGAINPEGWQLDMEGAVMPRLDLESKNDLVAVDFRFGVPVTYREGPRSYKFGYYHISSHVGDEFLEDNPTFVRDHYVKEALVAAISHEFDDRWRVYGEVGYAFVSSDSASPWEFQFGLEYSALANSGVYSSPFAAANVHLREEFNFGGSFNLQAGWQWRGKTSDRLWRMGFQYFNGATNQYVLGLENEEQIGAGLWFDY